MKNTRQFPPIRRFVAFAATAVFLTHSLHAEVPKKWSELTTYLRGKYVTIVSKDGRSVRGHFVGTSPNAVLLNTGNGGDLMYSGSFAVPRATFTTIRVDPEPVKLEKLGHDLHSGYAHAFRRLFSEAAPLGIVEVPAVTVWAVISAPFCALGDLFAPPRGMTENVQIVD
jgi:hypothetical protein